MILAPVAASYVADRLLHQAVTEGRLLTSMQLLKLVYISHGWMLGLLDQPLLSESIEAWRYGPVVRSIHRKYRKWRADPIASHGAPHERKLEPQQQHLIDQVFMRYRRYSGIELSRLTHQPGTAWDIAWRSGMSIIPDELIRYCYRRRGAELTARAARCRGETERSPPTARGQTGRTAGDFC